ncbi:hypothetical protein [Paraburkholderia sp. Tr-20389]|uniref:hypothetical protein n=1 Tax=Paraburkholderia sp. Tr-20389 TaxID=2703903 RepID=UPI001F11FC75|nr:hypothetical protein [Paraburkholderia sp. Tr-20389]
MEHLIEHFAMLRGRDNQRFEIGRFAKRPDNRCHFDCFWTGTEKHGDFSFHGLGALATDCGLSRAMALFRFGWNGCHAMPTDEVRKRHEWLPDRNVDSIRVLLYYGFLTISLRKCTTFMQFALRVVFHDESSERKKAARNLKCGRLG